MAGDVTGVVSSGAAAAAGLKAGDRLLAIDGLACSDEIDVRFRGIGGPVTLTILREGEERSLRVDASDDLGLEFADALFDGVRPCVNRCPFCFVDQMPPGLRLSLYVKDDDFRLSFLHGAYVTLTNLAPADEQRIIEQRLSPLYASVQALSPEVREVMFGRGDDGGLAALARLASAGIGFHCQIVLCPGYNDGRELELTLEFLRGLGRSIRSVAVVPVGLTRHRPAGSGIRSCTKEDALAAVATVEQFRGQWWRQCGRSVVTAADELFLLAGLAVPDARYYEGYPQLENGVGLVRGFLDEWVQVAPHPPVLSCVIITGNRFGPILAEVLEGHGAHVLTVNNELFGSDVTVAGLLGGADVVRALSGIKADGPVLIPDSAVRGGRGTGSEGTFLDQWTVSGVSASTGRQIMKVPGTARGLARVLGGNRT